MDDATPDEDRGQEAARARAVSAIEGAERSAAQPRPAEGSSWTEVPLDQWTDPAKRFLTVDEFHDLWEARIDHWLEKALAPALTDLLKQKTRQIQALEARLKKTEESI